MYKLKRLKKIKEKLEVNSNQDQVLSSFKPPIFWKDKATIILQAQKWNKTKINSILEGTFNLEILFKSNSQINQTILLKKLLIDICHLANA